MGGDNSMDNIMRVLKQNLSGADFQNQLAIFVPAIQKPEF